MKKQRFATRLSVFVIGLITAIQSFSLLTTHKANIQNAERVIYEQLLMGAKIFDRIIQERTQTLFEHTRLLSADHAFKQVFHVGDKKTLLSELDNLLDYRLHSADAILIFDLEKQPIVHTFSQIDTDSLFRLQSIISIAEADAFSESTGIAIVNKHVFQWMLTPLLSPDITAWIMIGFELDQRLMKDFSVLLNAEVSLLTYTKGWQVHHSSNIDYEQGLLKSWLDHLPAAPVDRLTKLPIESNVMSLLVAMGNRTPVFFMLKKTMTRALQPYKRLNEQLLVLFFTGLLFAVLCAVFLARRVSQPVSQLLVGVRQIERGNYRHIIPATQTDELGQLTHSFNKMAKGLMEKERVRNLLGKVVSDSVAEELLQKGVELGGEEKEVTVLFSDIRNFTALSEAMSPDELLAHLNALLTQLSRNIEHHFGVVDKYIGDAIMALFGAPVARDLDGENAVRCALDLVTLTRQFNLNSGAGLPLSIGVGINTAQVIVGNMGSESRLNYTAIGDGVNLASRLEGLSKYYKVPVIVSESTKDTTTSIAYRELDFVRVKGKQQGIKIFEAIGLKSDISHEAQEKVIAFEAAIQFYRNRRWQLAEKTFKQLQKDRAYYHICALYLQRLQLVKDCELTKDWDGCYHFDHK